MRITNLTVMLCLLWSVPAMAQTSWDFPRVVYHTCYDGDTCTVSLPGVHPLLGDHIAIRLLGIDTPEMKGRCAKESALARTARDFVRDRLSHATEIRLVTASRGDKYFRVLGRLVVDGQDLSEALLAAKLAVVYQGGAKTAHWCEP